MKSYEDFVTAYNEESTATDELIYLQPSQSFNLKHCRNQPSKSVLEEPELEIE